jgi:hypothetical protein
MKFLKQKNISRFSITDNTLFATSTGRAVMDLTGALRLPKGTGDPLFAEGTAENQRPDRFSGLTPNGEDGYIRYNTTINPLTGVVYGIEALVDGVWEIVRAPGAKTITKQEFLGDGGTSNFGPLTQTPNSPDNIIVLVENVMQISTRNYNLVSGNTRIEFTSPVPLGKYVTIYYGYAN